MPITLPPISRRRFLAGSVAAAASFALSRFSFALQPPRTDADRFVLLSDTHIDADPAKLNRETNMSANLQKVAAALLALWPSPAAVLHGGDVAHSSGTAGDYEAFLKLVKPVREFNIPWHLALGNHDNRERFWTAEPQRGVFRPIEDRHITRVESPKADWYLLDSLDKTNVTPGVLGEKQLTWLAKNLDERPDKPAIVMTHHQPLPLNQPKPEKFGGLTDSAALTDLLSPRKQVKALIFGHTHDWNVWDTAPDGLHRINLPPTAYVFKKGKPAGMVDVQLADGQATFKLLCLDEKHDLHGQSKTLKWR